MKCVGLTLPGFNAMFLILKPERITDEIEATVDLFFDLLGEGVSDYAFIVFTHIKNEQMKKEYFGRSGDAAKLDELLHRFKGKTLFIDNEADVSTKAGMVWRILNEIDENTAKLKVPYFTNEITEEMEKIAIDVLKTQSPGLTNVDDINTYDKKGDTSKESSQQNNKTLVPETLDKYGEGSTEENKSEGDSCKQQNQAALLKTSYMQGETSQQQNKTEEPTISEEYDNCSEEYEPDVEELFALYKRLVSKEQNDMQGDSSQQQNKTEPKISEKYDNCSKEQDEPDVEKLFKYYMRLLEDKELSVIGKVRRYFLKRKLLKVLKKK
ncbi:hypothetical protein DPMN_118037 [Dreissena polymorpha]|uniref:AIG1-type G domain-containing protein n=1 Tax=Dreissena polymorpha TaxID=45954 RepID=A0A9D4GG55_DREPO|nr:hypothetical protein DPMN_118037 [Dreissena polymorpha]